VRSCAAISVSQCKKPKDAEPEKPDPESVQQDAKDLWLPAIAAGFRVNTDDHRSRHLGSRWMVEPFADTECQNPQPDQQGGDELRRNGGNRNHAAGEGCNVPPAVGLELIEVHGDRELSNFERVRFGS